MAEARAWSATNVGQKRKSNEDAVFADSGLGLFAVADGMGGHAAGEVASETALSVVVSRLSADTVRSAHTAADLGNVGAALVDAIKEASRQVFRLANVREEYAGMGTTLTAVALVGDRALVAHVGDSRLYLVRGGKGWQMTADHTLVGEMLRQGIITEEQAEKSAHRNVLSRAIGTEPEVKVDSFMLDLGVGDTLVLCTDGLADYLETPEQLAQIADADVAGAADAFVQLANERGGRDNISVVVVHLA